MALLSLELIGLATGCAFLVDFPIRFHKAGLIGVFSESLMLGFLIIGAGILILNPDLSNGLELLGGYTPHLYNLIIWPVFSLVILRPKFGSKSLIPAFMMVYGIDEILWNALAYFRFYGEDQVLFFMYTGYWEIFFGIMIGFAVLGFTIIKPRIKPNFTWLALLIYGLIWAYLANFPTGANSLYNFGWELFWQIGIWSVIASTFFKRKSKIDI